MTTEASADGDVLLDVQGVTAMYEGVGEALRDVSLVLRRGEMLAVAGANGAGKTTLARAISNLLPAERGRVTRGTLLYDGRDILREPPARLVRRGLVPVLEGRRCFSTLTVEENLLTGATARGSNRATTRHDLDEVYGLFPRLAANRTIAAGRTSGGEQQMVAIARALMAHPRLLILDEPSMGLAPLAIASIFETLRSLVRTTSLTILCLDQNAHAAGRYADRLQSIADGTTRDEDASRSNIESSYFGEDPARDCTTTNGLALDRR